MKVASLVGPLGNMRQPTWDTGLHSHSSVQREDITDLPLYLEQRDCERPNAEQILRLFSLAERHRLSQSAHRIRVFHVQFTARRRKPMVDRDSIELGLTGTQRLYMTQGLDGDPSRGGRDYLLNPQPCAPSRGRLWVCKISSSFSAAGETLLVHTYWGFTQESAGGLKARIEIPHKAKYLNNKEVRPLW